MFDFGKCCEILRHKTQKYAFAKINISILQGYATVDFSIVLPKVILFLVYIGIIIRIIPSLHISVNLKI